MTKSPAHDSYRALSSTAFSMEKPGNALPSPISLPTQPNALRSRISDYYLLTPLSVQSLSKIAHIYRLIVLGSLAIVTLCSVTASFMTCYLRKTTEAPAISTRPGLPTYRAWTVRGRSQRGALQHAFFILGSWSDAVIWRAFFK